MRSPPFLYMSGTSWRKCALIFYLFVLFYFILKFHTSGLNKMMPSHWKQKTRESEAVYWAIMMSRLSPIGSGVECVSVWHFLSSYLFWAPTRCCCGCSRELEKELNFSITWHVGLPIRRELFGSRRFSKALHWNEVLKVQEILFKSKMLEEAHVTK